MNDQTFAQVDQAEEIDFLTPQQRINAIAEILATIALRIVKADHEKDQS